MNAPLKIQAAIVEAAKAHNCAVSAKRDDANSKLVWRGIGCEAEGRLAMACLIYGKRHVRAVIENAGQTPPGVTLGE